MKLLVFWVWFISITFLLHVSYWDQNCIFLLGVTKIGLTKICIQFKNDSEELCESLDLQTHWAVSLVFIVIGISLSFVAVFLLMLTVWRRTSEKLARIIGFMASKCCSIKQIFCKRSSQNFARLSKFKHINYFYSPRKSSENHRFSDNFTGV